ncbi:MAG: glycerophosphoryl diester phosphodiesterase membrane domain-containing protein [Planctomycetaceae bacterium]
MSNQPTAVAPHGYRFGEYLAQGVKAYVDQPGAWLVQMLIAAGISLVALACCILPSWLVAGPLSCGLHYTGLLAIRGEKVSPAALKRGWTRAGTSMIASLAMLAMQILPGILLYALFTAGSIAMMMSRSFAPIGVAVGPPAAPPAAAVAPAQTNPVGDDTGDQSDASQELNSSGAGSVPQPQIAPTAVPPTRVAYSPAPRALITMAVTLIAFYGFAFLGMFAFLIWTFWFGTKTMYVMPLIADRGCGFLEALEESWRLTTNRFWEMFLLFFLVSITAGIGIYACFAGVIFTLPIYFTVIAAAYQGHALPQYAPQDDHAPAPSASPAVPGQ